MVSGLIELIVIIFLGEDSTIEFYKNSKSPHKDSFTYEIVAFVYASGGAIFLRV